MTDTETPGGTMPHQIPENLADVNADLSRRVVVDTGPMAWEPSPSGTVWRKPLYRSGGEHGPVTSLVRYAPGGTFREHAHPEGEEILVLDGVFCDEHGDYPAGPFLTNPHGSRHLARLRLRPTRHGGCSAVWGGPG
jgi:anti-sigma factor ChrR (cupin superfamily)